MTAAPEPEPEPVTRTAPRRVRRAVLTQQWRDVAFLHWPVDPAAVGALLPAGLRPDTLDGRCYVGLIALRIVRTGVLGGPGLPYLGSMAETNVRLYSVDGQGRRGVVFRSMDASRLVPALAGRWAAGLPYTWSRLRVRRDGDLRTYTARRRWPGRRGGSSAVTIRVGAPITAPTALDDFLTARWALHVPGRDRTRFWPNEHAAWPLHRAEVEHLADELVGAAGVALPDGPPASVLWSPGLRVRFGPREPG